LIVESRQTIENNLLSLSVGSWQFMKTCMKTQQVFFYIYQCPPRKRDN